MLNGKFDENIILQRLIIERFGIQCALSFVEILRKIRNAAVEAILHPIGLRPCKIELFRLVALRSLIGRKSARP